MIKIARKFILTIWLLSTTVTLIHCQTQNPQTMQPAINLDSLLSTYTSMPNYYASYSNSGCRFDLRINDGYTEKIFRPGNSGGTLLPINGKILKSGKQTFSVRLYPNPGEEVITAKNPFTLEIGYKDFKVESGTEGRPWHSVYKMPPVVVPDSGLPYYEFSGEFEAIVPYEVRGWSDCIDLREIPDIEQRVVAKFKEIRRLMIENDFEQYSKLCASKDLDLGICFYNTNQDYMQELKNHYKSISEGKPEEYQSIEDYNLVFYADGRLVTLESNKRKGYCSALLWLRKLDGANRSMVFDMRLGIRQGTNELVPIR